MAERVVVIGAVALGPKAAARCKRLCPEAHVTLIDQSTRISYGGCGIPFYVSGEVNRVDELQETPYHTLRDAAFFKTHKGVDVLVRTRATAINRAERTVTVENVDTGAVSTVPYDKLVLAMGSSPFKPPLPGLELAGISAATNLEEAEFLRTEVAAGRVNHVVVVGGGFIGLEMAVAFADMWGIPVSVVELADQILPNFLSASLSHMAVQDLQSHNVQVFTGEKVLRFEGEGGRVARVVTDKRTIEAELVVMAAGVRPNSQLAVAAGLAVAERGQVLVDEQMRTSDPNIYAGGDLASVKNLVTGKPGWFPLGSMANRQGRVIGTNVAGGSATFPGAVGSWGIKLFDYAAAGAGLTIEAARREGFDAIKVHMNQLDRAHFYPERDLMTLELVAERGTNRVLGVQGISPNGDALIARINAVAHVLGHGCLVEDISNLEVVYTPPFASAMDIINAIGNVAENILAGRLVPVEQEEFASLWQARQQGDVYFLDARAHKDAEAMVEKYPGEWHSIPQDEIAARIAEVPKDKPIVVVCNTGLRSYEAQLGLAAHGITNTRSVLGGMSSAKRLGSKI